MSELREKISESVAYIRKHTKMRPEIGIILGTGLGGLVKEIRKEIVLDYDEIPHFPVSTVESHHGRLIFGTLVPNSRRFGPTAAITTFEPAFSPSPAE